ncbi:hypothetical protein [Flavobacterium urumqiense]|uniref:Uncharacterized protein n=1 Tax=Flavobacterium urumqiense TaxID=935224 RepID=A0A1H6AMQ8_9FLAO|nr:hypothetical protein [Flavobacterium urumqiense]SEG49464.1 hypothetical protein SAMN04488130_11745 [Flavobacterium urumqiense]
MKKIGVLLAMALFTITVGAQETKPDVKEKAKKESCCAKADSNIKVMTAAEVEKCQAKCKAEGKKCDTKMAQTEGKKCDATMAKAEGKKCCAKKA